MLYATSSDLIGFDGDVDHEPATAERFLRQASGIVQHAIRFDRYDTAPSGVPLDADLLAAVRDATCAQVVSWTLNTIDPGTVGLATGEIASVSEGDRSVTYKADPTVAAVRAAAGDRLCSDADRILRNAGFLTGQPSRV
jgi:hypothetical protein